MPVTSYTYLPKRHSIDSFHKCFFGPKVTSHDEDSDDEQLDMDSMRQKLSNLFHRVSEVCTAEFQLIANVFSTPASLGKGGDAAFELTSLSDAIPFQVARALLQRVISDPHDGLQGRINDLLDSIDRVGDFDAGTRKLDTFVVIHEKAAGLFTIMKESAQTMLMPAGKSGRSGDRRLVLLNFSIFPLPPDD